jgi:hypothetical protein
MVPDVSDVAYVSVELLLLLESLESSCCWYPWLLIAILLFATFFCDHPLAGVPTVDIFPAVVGITAVAVVIAADGVPAVGYIQYCTLYKSESPSLRINNTPSCLKISSPNTIFIPLILISSCSFRLYPF